MNNLHNASLSAMVAIVSPNVLSIGYEVDGVVAPGLRLSRISTKYKGSPFGVVHSHILGMNKAREMTSLLLLRTQGERNKTRRRC
jgi:hypothetical protein